MALYILITAHCKIWLITQVYLVPKQDTQNRQPPDTHCVDTVSKLNIQKGGNFETEWRNLEIGILNGVLNKQFKFLSFLLTS